MTNHPPGQHRPARRSTEPRAYFVARPDGLGAREVPAVSVAEMRAIEQIAIGQTGPSRLQMMEHAGMQVALAALDMLGEGWPDARVLVLAGSGNTGATGVCAARHLANRGVEVAVVTIRHPARTDGALGQQFLALGEAPARIVRWDDAFDVDRFDLVIDAVLGTGLEGAPRAAHMGLTRAANAARTPVLAIDVPSGIDADTGEAAGAAVRATRTLALGLPKRGLRRSFAGELWLADLGIPPGVFARAGVAFAPFFGAEGRVKLDYPDA